MKFRDEFGKTVTQEQLEKWDEEITSGDFDNWTQVGEIYCGELQPANYSKDYISVQVPSSIKKAVQIRAKKNKCTQSELVRSYILQGLATR
jgi:hypothetical protein